LDYRAIGLLGNRLSDYRANGLDIIINCNIARGSEAEVFMDRIIFAANTAQALKASSHTHINIDIIIIIIIIIYY